MRWFCIESMQNLSKNKGERKLLNALTVKKEEKMKLNN